MQLLIIGAGAIAREHARAAESISSISTVHVADPNPSAVAAFLESFPTARAHADVSGLLGAGRSGDIVIIATPPVSHYELTIAALEGGFHVLCEKPLAFTAEQAVAMGEAARARGLLLWNCDSRFRGLAATQSVRALSRSGDLGDIYHATFVHRRVRSRSGYEYQPQSAWFRDVSVSGGGVGMDWGPYDIALIDEVLEPVQIEVVAAWSDSPQIGGPLAAESRLLDQHIGAFFRVTGSNGNVIAVDYERAAATHGLERDVVELDGTHEGVSWNWLDGDERTLTRFSDDNGEQRTEVTEFAPPEVSFFGRPLADMVSYLAAGDDLEFLTNRSVFTFLVLRAVIESASDGKPRIVRKDLR